MMRPAFRVLFLLLLLAAGHVSAQEKQILSITPPLFQLSANPGDAWQSSIKVVNGNPYPMSVYAEVVNFAPTGELGHGRFIPVISDDAEKVSLAEWITIAEGPHTVPPESTKNVTFLVEVPQDAPPGGHYAAILISTRPPREDGERLAVQTAQAVTSLFFVRIEGDIEERGDIREFRVTDPLVPRTHAEFLLRFENKGNVHLQPRGDIEITNMWGTEQGRIPINYDTHFGNVLPESIREFRFKWERDFSITDVGRYKAIVTLGYGEDGVKSVSSVAYFWVVPVKATLLTLLILGLFVAAVVWMIKAYIRRMLMLAGVDPDQKREVVDTRHAERKPRVTYAKVSAPLRSGVLDLRQRLDTAHESSAVLGTIWQFVLQYKAFFLSLLALIVIFVVVSLYIGRATDTDQDYRVIVDEGGEERLIQGRDIGEE